MKVRRTFICLIFFPTLQDGNTGLLGPDIERRTEGGNITVRCSFFFSGRRGIFCKDECEKKDILVETTGGRAERGRYSIVYTEGFYPVFPTLLNVSITNLTKSDSGRYRCRLDRSLRPDSYEEFEIRVEDAPPLRPYSTSVPSASTLTTTQSLSSSSGSSTPSSASTGATSQTHQQRTTPAADPGVLLYVGLILLVVIIILSAAVLIFCRTRASKPKEPPAETEYANVTEPNRVYEEVREEHRQSRSPPVDVSTVYTYAKHTKPNGAETTDDYSVATAAGSQKKAEDDWSKLTYSEVDFSRAAAASLNSAPGGDADNVVYSVPRVAASSDGSHADDASPPLYSTVTQHPL